MPPYYVQLYTQMRKVTDIHHRQTEADLRPPLPGTPNMLTGHPAQQLRPCGQPFKWSPIRKDAQRWDKLSPVFSQVKLRRSQSSHFWMPAPGWALRLGGRSQKTIPTKWSTLVFYSTHSWATPITKPTLCFLCTFLLQETSSSWWKDFSLLQLLITGFPGTRLPSFQPVYRIHCWGFMFQKPFSGILVSQQGCHGNALGNSIKDRAPHDSRMPQVQRARSVPWDFDKLRIMALKQTPATPTHQHSLLWQNHSLRCIKIIHIL